MILPVYQSVSSYSYYCWQCPHHNLWSYLGRCVSSSVVLDWGSLWLRAGCWRPPASLLLYSFGDPYYTYLFVWVPNILSLETIVQRPFLCHLWRLVLGWYITPFPWALPHLCPLHHYAVDDKVYECVKSQSSERLLTFSCCSGKSQPVNVSVFVTVAKQELKDQEISQTSQPLWHHFKFWCIMEWNASERPNSESWLSLF